MTPRHFPTAFLLSLLVPAAAAQDAAADAKLLASACNRFAADLHGNLAAAGRPTAAPGSVALALLMLVPGARGDTEQELCTLLHLPAELRGERLQGAAKKLLDTVLTATKGKPDALFPQLRIANDLWALPGYAIRSEYTNALRSAFGAGVRSAPFASDPNGARNTINAYIAKATNQRIPELLAPDTINAQTRVVLTNAIWLRASWQHPFADGMTKPQPFTLADGTAVATPTMQTRESFAYAETADWQCVVLPFAHCDLVAEFVLPRAGKPLATAEQALLEGRATANLAAETVEVRLPRFRVTGSHRLREALLALGLRTAFAAGRADFSGITGKPDLVVDDVVHQTWIQVDENGAEAAAATAVIAKTGSAAHPREPRIFAAERPFAFTLRDRTSGLVLFVARVEDPRESPAAAQPSR